MALEDIKKKILSDAEAKKEAMLKEASDKKEAVLASYKKKAAEFARDIKEKAAAEADGLKRGIVIDARLRRKNEALARKRALMEKAIADGMADFMASKDYPSRMEALLSLSGLNEGEVVVSEGDKALDQKWLDTASKKAGGKFKLARSKGGFTGGFIVRSGEVAVNATLETLLNVKREELEKELVAVLFR